MFFLLFCISSWCYATILTPEVIAKIEHNQAGEKQKRFHAWARLITEHSADSDLVKLKRVNAFFNQFEYRSDAKQIGRQDYWMTPIEFISYGGGDCEDYAIAKYFTLEAMGVADEKLQITYVKALQYNAAHMVLTYYELPTSVPLVLDNLIGEIKPASQRNDLRPVYSFNARGLWLSKQRGQGRLVSGSDRLSVWQDLNKRMIAQLDQQVIQ